jgi:hypothetical protein
MSQPGSPIELRWSKEPYSTAFLAETDAQTMALLAAQEDCIQVDATGPEIVSLDGEHKGHFVLGSRIEHGKRAYYTALHCSDWGQSNPGVWSTPFEDQKEAAWQVEFNLENWMGAMDQFADCMIPPEEIDLYEPHAPTNGL